MIFRKFLFTLTLLLSGTQLLRLIISVLRSGLPLRVRGSCRPTIRVDPPRGNFQNFLVFKKILLIQLIPVMVKLLLFAVFPCRNSFLVAVGKIILIVNLRFLP